MKNCKGCPAKRYCSYTKHSNNCPCRICIVKVMCGSMCDKHIIFQVRSYALNADAYNEQHITGDI
jgi:hypothetical protein